MRTLTDEFIQAHKEELAKLEGDVRYADPFEIINAISPRIQSTFNTEEPVIKVVGKSIQFEHKINNKNKIVIRTWRDTQSWSAECISTIGIKVYRENGKVISIKENENIREPDDTFGWIDF